MHRTEFNNESSISSQEPSSDVAQALPTFYPDLNIALNPADLVFNDFSFRSATAQLDPIQQYEWQLNDSYPPIEAVPKIPESFVAHEHIFDTESSEEESGSSDEEDEEASERPNKAQKLSNKTESTDVNTASGESKSAGDTAPSSSSAGGGGASSVVVETRAKNREHAKKTRIRKKNYLATLTQEIEQLQRDSERVDARRTSSLTSLVDQVSEMCSPPQFA